MHVRAARDEHVRPPPRQIQIPLRIHVPDIARPEPSVAKRRRIRRRILPVSRTDRRPRDADLAALPWPQRTAILVGNAHLHPRPLHPARPLARRPMILGPQHRDRPRHLAQTIVLHQHRPQPFKRKPLIFLVHRRPGIDDRPQRRPPRPRVLDQALDDRRHREKVRDPVPLHRRPGRGRLERPRQDHARRPRSQLHQRMHPRPMAQGRHHQRPVPMPKAREQIIEMIENREGHLALRQHHPLRPPGRPRGEEQPARIVARHIRIGQVPPQPRRDQCLIVCPDDPADPRLPRCRGMAGKALTADHRHRPGDAPLRGHLARGQAEVTGAPDRAQPETGKLHLDASP